MKRFTIQLETQLDLIDLVKIINKYEKLGMINLVNILEQTPSKLPEWFNKITDETQSDLDNLTIRKEE